MGWRGGSVAWRIWPILLGLGMITALILAAFFAPLPHPPNQPHTAVTLQPPSGTYWFGTDGLGRDVFARVIRAGRIDLPTALGGTLVSLVIGVLIGLAVSVKTPWAQRVMRGVDMLQSFPLLILALAIVELAHSGLASLVIAIAIVSVPLFIRLVRSEALALRESRFVEAAFAIGAKRQRVLLHHVLPNVIGIILVQASLTVSRALLVESALSFLGVGVQPPTPSLGAMIRDGTNWLSTGAWWTVVFPGLAIFVAVFAFNQIADRLDIVLGRGAYD